MEIESTGSHVSRIEAAIRKRIRTFYESYEGIRFIHIQELP